MEEACTVKMSRGSYAYRRTLEFLSRGRLHLKNSVKVVTLKYSPVSKSSAGLRYNNNYVLIIIIYYNNNNNYVNFLSH